MMTIGKCSSMITIKMLFNQAQTSTTKRQENLQMNNQVNLQMNNQVILQSSKPRKTLHKQTMLNYGAWEHRQDQLICVISKLKLICKEQLILLLLIKLSKHLLQMLLLFINFKHLLQTIIHNCEYCRPTFYFYLKNEEN